MLLSNDLLLLSHACFQVNARILELLQPAIVFVLKLLLLVLESLLFHFQGFDAFSGFEDAPLEVLLVLSVECLLMPAADIKNSLILTLCCLYPSLQALLLPCPL